MEGLASARMDREHRMTALKKISTALLITPATIEKIAEHIKAVGPSPEVKELMALVDEAACGERSHRL